MPTLPQVTGQSLTSRTLMSRYTGKDISDMEHLGQSIIDILTTPLGSRVMRREYGSNLFKLIDAPMNRSTILQIYAATVQAITRWEPRIRITRVELDASNLSEGQLLMNIYGYYLIDARLVRLENLTLDFYKDSRYSRAA